jgi:hypothetical protein
VRPNYYRAHVKVSDPKNAGNRIEVDVECFDLIDALGLNFYTGNALKYLWRAGRKTDDVVEDLVKAKTYLEQEIDRRRIKP